jgi:hypothetical protein
MAINSPHVEQPSREKSEKNHLFAMALEVSQGDGSGEIAREFAMPKSPASDSLFLPFGSLMGAIPVDSIKQGRVLGNFSSVVAGAAQRLSEVQQQIHWAIDPIPAAPSGGQDLNSPRLFASVPFRGCRNTASTALPPSLVPSGDGGI